MAGTAAMEQDKTSNSFDLSPVKSSPRVHPECPAAFFSIKGVAAIAILVTAAAILARNWYDARHSREHFPSYPPDRTAPAEQPAKGSPVLP
jgi:hypothetical protein